ncbi:hypothetical protein [Mucilaginibacter sp.]|uniref:hypothetical protein n=1 Tax=Mucilaginibacter sp. TaxID=1882438 RepID=UPI0035BC6C54
MNNKQLRNTIAGVISGLVAYSAIGKLGLYLLQLSWAEYAVHNTDKKYTVTMLLARLVMGMLAAIAAGIICAILAKDKGKSAWLVSVIVFLVAAYIHLLTAVWMEYPVWYHFTYLLPIIPTIMLSHHLAKAIAFRQKG